MEHKEYSSAIEIATVLVLSKPDNYNFQFIMANALHANDDIDSAIDFYKNALIIRPSDPFAYFRLAQCYWSKKIKKYALESVKMAIHQSKNDKSFSSIRNMSKALLSEIIQKK